MTDLMAFLTNPQNLLSLVVGLLAFGAILGLVTGLSGGQKLNKRMKAVGERRDELKRRSRQAIAQQGQGVVAVVFLCGGIVGEEVGLVVMPIGEIDNEGAACWPA